MFEKKGTDKQKSEFTASSAESSTEVSASSQPTSVAGKGSSAVIGASIVVKGDVSGDEDLLIEGRVEGNVDLSTHQLSIGRTGQVDANVTAKMIRIEGEVKGDIVGLEKVIISKSGNVRGNIVAPRVTLEDGAKFKGSIDMDPGDVAAAKPKPAVRQQPQTGSGAPEQPTGQVSGQ